MKTLLIRYINARASHFLHAACEAEDAGQPASKLWAAHFAYVDAWSYLTR